MCKTEGANVTAKRAACDGSRRACVRGMSFGVPVLPPDGNAPLAQGRALLEDSAKARDAILALLEATPPPEPPQP